VTAPKPLPLLRPLGVAAATTLLAAASSYLLAGDWASAAVGLTFLGAVYLTVLRHQELDLASWGLEFGGLLGREPTDLARCLKRAASATLLALGLAVVTFPLYVGGFMAWWQPERAFDFSALPSAEEVLGQFLAVALPEEAFYRGYLQTALAQTALFLRGGPVWNRWGPILSSSLIFALGHVLTEPDLTRLSVFFPSLLFGWLRARSFGIGASVIFHALCNLLALYLGRGFGLIG
jgi:membrane protease YdiL (CAAX protease family)